VEIELTKDIAQALKGTFHGFRGKITVKTKERSYGRVLPPCTFEYNGYRDQHGQFYLEDHAETFYSTRYVKAKLVLTHQCRKVPERTAFSQGTYTFTMLRPGPYKILAMQSNGKKGHGAAFLRPCSHETITITRW
jgi:hypothetical protein